MNTEYFLFIFFPVMILMFVNSYYHFLKLRVLLRKHHKPVSNILWSLGLLRDFKQAKLLIKELGESSEGKKIKTALRQTDIAFFMVPVMFFALGVLFIYLLSLNPNVKFF